MEVKGKLSEAGVVFNRTVKCDSREERKFCKSCLVFFLLSFFVTAQDPIKKTIKNIRAKAQRTQGKAE